MAVGRRREYSGTHRGDQRPETRDAGRRRHTACDMFAVSTDLTALIKETLWPIGHRLELGSDAARTTERLAAILHAGFDGVELCMSGGARLTQDAINSAIEALAHASIVRLERGGEGSTRFQSLSGAAAAGKSHRDVTDTVQDGTEARALPRGGAPDRPLRVLALAARLTTTDLDEACRELTNLLESARRLGADCVNLSLSDIYGSGAENAASRVHQGGAPRPSFGYPSLPAFVGRLIVQSRFAAEAAGVGVAIECGPDTAPISPVELANLIDEASTWIAGACVAHSPSSVILMGSVSQPRATGLQTPGDWLGTLRHRVRCVRIDTLPIHPVVQRALDSIAYVGPIIVRRAIASLDAATE